MCCATQDKVGMKSVWEAGKRTETDDYCEDDECIGHGDEGRNEGVDDELQ